VTYTGRSHWRPDAIVALVHIHEANRDKVEGAKVTALWTLPDESIYPAEGAQTNVQGIDESSIFEGAGD
jgi:hypothetical protein